MNTLDTWHEIAASGDASRLEDILAPDCVFFSPVVYKPQPGRDITRLYLTAAFQVLLPDFKYTKEVVSGQHAVLEFEALVDGVTINGVDIMTFDDAGRICEFKVMVRPLKAVNLLHAKMKAMLEQMA